MELTITIMDKTCKIIIHLQRTLIRSLANLQVSVPSISSEVDPMLNYNAIFRKTATSLYRLVKYSAIE